VARRELTVVTSTMGGSLLDPSSSSTGGLMFTNNGRSFLGITNAASSGGRRLVIGAAQLVDGDSLEVADRSIILGLACSSEDWEAILGPFRPSIYNQLSGTDVGKLYLDMATTASSEADYTPLTAAQSSELTFWVVTAP